MSTSKSGIETWFSCARKWKYTYIDGVESVMPMGKEARFGVGFHKLLEQHYLGQDTDWAAVDLEGTEKSTAAALFAEYVRLYPRPEGVVGAEVPFQLEGLHGIFDAVYRDGDTVVVVEHKTTKTDFSVNELYWDKVRSDWQVGMYQLAAREVYGTSNVIVLYDVIRVPQLRQGKATAADFRERIAVDIASNTERYYGQAKVKWTDSALQELRDDLADTAAQIAFAKATARYPRSRKCFEWNRQCEWHPVCFQGASLSDERLYQLRTRR